MITVLGATGNTGREVTRLLLAAGEQVRAVGRSRVRLAAVDGAVPCAGDAGDAEFLTGAFHGADAAFVMFPYDPQAPDHAADQERRGTAIVRAIRDAGVAHVVALSSVGADLPTGTGFIASLHAHENRLRTLEGVDVLVLRPGSFFENFGAAVPVIHELGFNADAVAPDVPIPMIATRDIAAVAASALLARDWDGTVVRELLGPCDLSYAEATAILGARLGLPDLRYVQLPEAEMEQVLQQAGFSADAAALHVELGRALSDGTIASVEGRTPGNTTPTRFEDVAAELVGAAA